MHEPHPQYPNLQLLSIPQCMFIFRKAGVTQRHLCALTGLSRQTVWAMWSGVKKDAIRAVQLSVSTLAYRSLRAMHSKRLPLKKEQATYDAVMDALLDGPETKPLSAYSSAELIPMRGDRSIQSTQHGPQ